VGGEAADDVLEVVADIEAVALGALDEAVEYRGGLRAVVAAGEQVVLAPDDDGPQRALDGVVVDADKAVVEVDAQLRSQVQGVGVTNRILVVVVAELSVVGFGCAEVCLTALFVCKCRGFWSGADGAGAGRWLSCLAPPRPREALTPAQRCQKRPQLRGHVA
jgi:hypothetical protein